MTSARRHEAVLALGGAAITLLAVAGLWAAFAEPTPPLTQHLALSPQECNTGCQSRQTDCILQCDGQVRCERACTEVGLRCVLRCQQAAPDSGSGGASGAGGNGP